MSNERLASVETKLDMMLNEFKDIKANYVTKDAFDALKERVERAEGTLTWALRGMAAIAIALAYELIKSH